MQRRTICYVFNFGCKVEINQCFNKMDLLGDEIQTSPRRKCGMYYLFRSLPKIVTFVI